MPRLTITPGVPGGTERHVELATGIVSIGRDASNTIALDGEGKSSRKHCQVAPVAGGGYEVVDLGSTNGTRVNGQPIERRRLRHGDVIEVGLTRLAFEDENAPKIAADVCVLEWTAGERKGERVPLTGARVSLGRRPSNTIVLDDKMASGHHAEIVKDLNGFTLRDLGSTNGTLVNGTPVTETMLSHGARVRIGNTKFVFRDPAMAHVEVALEGLEEDDGGWGMMGELDLSKARGGRSGLVGAVVLLGLLGAGAWFAMNRTTATEAVAVDTANLLTDGVFDATDSLAWTVDEGVPALVERSASGGRPGRGGFLLVRHDGKSARAGIARYVADLDLSGQSAYGASAWMKRDGAGRAELAVQWTRRGNARTGSTGVVQTVPIGSPGKPGAWTQVSRVVRRPSWAEAARLVVLVAPEASARLDDVRFEEVTAPGAGGKMPVGSDTELFLAASGGLDLVRNATVLALGATPWARLPDGRTLGGASGFVPDAVPVPSGEEFELTGRLVDAQGEVPAKISWTRLSDGLTAKVSVEGAAAVGLCVDVPQAHLEAGIGVVGAFGSRTVSAQAAPPLAEVRRALFGDPKRREEGNRPPTLLALDVAGGEARGALWVLEDEDPGLARLVLALEGASGEIRLVTNFSGERQRAQQSLREAMTLLDRAPSQGIVALRQVAEEFAFQDDVRREALAKAAEREDRARQDFKALTEAAARFAVYRDEASLAAAEALATDLAAQFPAGAGAAGGLELSVRDLAAQVATERALFDIRRAGPDVARFARLAELLEGEEGYGPLAAVYWDALVRRYGGLLTAAAGVALTGADAETLQRVQEARKRRDALLQKADVAAAFPQLAE